MGSMGGDGSQLVTEQELQGEHQTKRDQSEAAVEDAPQIHYFAKPNSTTVGSVLIIIFYHMFPFSGIPQSILCYWAYYLLRESRFIGLTAYLGFLTFLAFVPFHYSKSVRRRARVFYEALAVYVPAAKFVIDPKDGLRNDKAYIFAFQPHGRMFYGYNMISQLHETWRVPLKLHKGDLFPTAAALFFHWPFVRSWFYSIGTMPASKKNIVNKLRNKDHVAIAVGGIKEVCLGTQDHTDVLYLKRRKGFLQIAMDEGAGVVPVYSFNETQMFKHESRIYLDFWDYVNKYVKLGAPLVRGWCNLPIPYRKELLVVFGDALFAKEGESLDEFQQRYIDSVRQLFDKYVTLSPDPNHKLVIT